MVTELINGLYDEIEKVYVMAADGSDIRPLVAADRRNNDQHSEAFYYVGEDNPVWSPDGTQILYTRWGTQWGEELIRQTTLCIADVATGETTCMPNGDSDEAWSSADWCRAG
jgi:Tol biopolymer transport system component